MKETQNAFELIQDIETGRNRIYWKADNLLDQQLMEAFADCITSSGRHLELLEYLRAYAKQGELV